MELQDIRKSVTGYRNVKNDIATDTKSFFAFSETSHEVRCLKGKKLMEPDFWGKYHFGDNAQKHPQNRIFWIFQKK